MFYKPHEPHGLPRNPFKACVVPRPIGWVTSYSREGVLNLAPFSFFNAMSSDPPFVVLGINGRQPHGPKDTVTNIEATGEFVCNVATWDLREAMNKTSAPAPAEVDEMAYAGLTPEPSALVAPPRVAESPIHLECTYHRTVDLPSDDPEGRNAVVFGRVVGIHVREEVLTYGLVDMAKLRPVARLGYMDYAVVTEVFQMMRPKFEAAAE